MVILTVQCHYCLRMLACVLVVDIFNRGILVFIFPAFLSASTK